MVTFGTEQYLWHADGPNGHPDPDGPPVTSRVPGGTEAAFVLPKASVNILRARVRYA